MSRNASCRMHKTSRGLPKELLEAFNVNMQSIVETKRQGCIKLYEHTLTLIPNGLSLLVDP